MAAKVVTSAECQTISLVSALRRAAAKKKDHKNDNKLRAEKVGKAKETLAEENVVVEKACVLAPATIAVAVISGETARTARARARAMGKPAKVLRTFSCLAEVKNVIELPEHEREDC